MANNAQKGSRHVIFWGGQLIPQTVRGDCGGDDDSTRLYCITHRKVFYSWRDYHDPHEDDDCLIGLLCIDHGLEELVQCLICPQI